MAKAQRGDGQGLAANKRAAEQAAKRDERILRRFLLALKQVLDTPDGRLVFGEEKYGVLAQGGLFADAFVPGDAGHATAYNAGRRAVVLKVRDLLILANPQMFGRMESEMRALRLSDEAVRAAEDQNAAAANGVADVES